MCPCVHLTESFELALPFAAAAVPLPNGANGCDALPALGRSFGANQTGCLASWIDGYIDDVAACLAGLPEIRVCVCSQGAWEVRNCEECFLNYALRML